MRAPSAWKVDTFSAASDFPASSRAERSRISRAALLVKVIAAMWAGSKPHSRTR
jgi:hypothetical protein